MVTLLPTGGATVGLLWGLLTAVILLFFVRLELGSISDAKVAAKLMTDAAHYFEASICILTSILAVQVLLIQIQMLRHHCLCRVLATLG